VRARAALCALFLGLPAGAGAQGFALPGVRADSSVLLGCLAGGRQVEECLGAMTEACMADNELGNDNLEERLCVAEELNIWRELLARAEARLRRRIEARGPGRSPGRGAEALSALAEAGVRWAAWRDSRCRLERAVAGGDGRRAIIGDICLRDLTADRYRQLQALGRRLAEAAR